MGFWVRLFIIYFVLFSSNIKCDRFDIKCTTWDGNLGVCIEKSNCEGFEEAFNQNETFVSKMVSDSECYGYSPNQVCCGLVRRKLIFPSISRLFPTVPQATVPQTTVPQTTVPQTTVPQTTLPPRIRTEVSYEDVIVRYKNLTKPKLLLGTDSCGRQQPDDTTVTRNYTPSIEYNEFPWLVHIVTENKSADFTCSGILINYDTVLTTYNCAANAEKARMGVNRLNEHRTCAPTSEKDDSPVCFGLEERDVSFINNPDVPELGILKLKSRVRYSGIIRSICLPVEENTKYGDDQLLYLSGWNLLNDEGSEFIKHKLVYRVDDNKKCQNLTFGSIEETFCMVGVHNFTENQRISEVQGAVTYYDDDNWFLAGFQWQTKQPDVNSNKKGGTSILGVSLTLRAFDWIFDNINA